MVYGRHESEHYGRICRCTGLNVLFTRPVLGDWNVATDRGVLGLICCANVSTTEQILMARTRFSVRVNQHKNNNKRKQMRTQAKVVKPVSRVATPHPPPTLGSAPPIKQAIQDLLQKLKQRDVMVHNLIHARVDNLLISWSPLLDEAGLVGHYQDGGYIMLNSAAVTSTNQLAPLLLHELMHSIGGTELDAKSYVNWIYPDYMHENPVTLGCFENNGGGKFTKIDPKSGKVTHLQTNKVIAKFSPLKKGGGKKLKSKLGCYLCI